MILTHIQLKGFGNSGIIAGFSTPVFELREIIQAAFFTGFLRVIWFKMPELNHPWFAAAPLTGPLLAKGKFLIPLTFPTSLLFFSAAKSSCAPGENLPLESDKNKSRCQPL